LGEPPVQTPDWQESTVVQALPSLQVVPFAAGGFEQAPLLELHMPAVWHWSLAWHTMGLAPTQVPLLQVSSWVHMFPSLHEVPSAGIWHPPAPSQFPVLPHVFEPVGQVFTVGSRGAAPAARLLHVPILFDRAHDWQPPVQLESQQIPVVSAARVFAQWPNEQSPSTPQVMPFASLSPHLFVCVLQVTPDAQSEAPVQVVRQLDALTLQA